MSDWKVEDTKDFLQVDCKTEHANSETPCKLESKDFSISGVCSLSPETSAIKEESNDFGSAEMAYVKVKIEDAIDQSSGDLEYMYGDQESTNQTPGLNEELEQYYEINQVEQLPGRVQRFSAEETDLLIHSVKVREQIIYGSNRNPKKLPKVRQAWEEIAAIVSSSSGITRSVAQCKKRYNDVRRRKKQKIDDRPKLSAGTETRAPGISVDQTSAVEDSAAYTIADDSIEGFEGPDVGIQDSLAECSQSGPSSQEQEPVEKEEQTPELPPSGTGTGTGTGTATEASRPKPRRGNMRQEDHPFLDLQQAGFNMLEGELGGLRRGVRQLNTRLGRIESMLRPLSDVALSLGRLAQVVECLASTTNTSTNTRRPPALITESPMLCDSPALSRAQFRHSTPRLRTQRGKRPPI